MYSAAGETDHDVFAWITCLCSLYCSPTRLTEPFFQDQALLTLSYLAISVWLKLYMLQHTHTLACLGMSAMTQCSVTQARVPTPAREAQEATSSRPSSQEIASQIEGFEDDFKVTKPLLCTNQRQ